MASDLAFTLFRLLYLVLLWAVALGAVSLLRQDIFGTVVTPRGKGRKQADKHLAESRRKRKRGAAPETPTKLLITGGPLVGTSMKLGNTDITIGRSPASTLVIDDEYASSRHARLHLDDEGWWIEDLGSTNGTFVDDERIAQPRRLSFGANVRIGRTTFELVS